MAWQNPKTNWKAGDIPTASDFNRIEGNIEELENTKETPTGAQAKVNTHAGSKQTHGISGSYYIAKTSRSDQLPAWNDIQGKPSLVTTSDLSNGLAAKVDKPSSATSGNIAVFDGGAGKIKDGGKKVADIPTLASGSYYSKPNRTVDKDTPLPISIPVGFTAKKGRLILQATPAGLYGIAFFSNVIDEAMALDISSSSPTIRHRGVHGVVFGTSTGLCVRDVYISGNNLVLYIMHGGSGSAQVTEVRIYWEVEK